MTTSSCEEAKTQRSTSHTARHTSRNCKHAGVLQAYECARQSGESGRAPHASHGSARASQRSRPRCAGVCITRVVTRRVRCQRVWNWQRHTALAQGREQEVLELPPCVLCESTCPVCRSLTFHKHLQGTQQATARTHTGEVPHSSSLRLFQAMHATGSKGRREGYGMSTTSFVSPCLQRPLPPELLHSPCLQV